MSNSKTKPEPTEKDTRIPLIREILSDQKGEFSEWTSKDMKEVLRKLLAQYNWERYLSELEFE